MKLNRTNHKPSNVNYVSSWATSNVFPMMHIGSAIAVNLQLANIQLPSPICRLLYDDISTWWS